MKKAFIISLFIMLFILIISGFWRWLIPYSFEPSYWEFKKLCELDPEIYQAKGGKLDEEYYNRVLAYFNTSLDNMSNVSTLIVSDDKEYYSYWFEKWLGDRINFSFTIWFNDEQTTKDNIKNTSFLAQWRNLRPALEGNEGSGFYFSGDRMHCFEFYCHYKNGVKVCNYE